MDNLKSIVVLKNLPSNIIDEAFVILKPNQKIEVTTNKQTEGGIPNSKNYIVKEAEMVINSYLKGNDNNNTKDELKKLQKKYKILKIASTIFGIGGIISFFLVKI